MPNPGEVGLRRGPGGHLLLWQDDPLFGSKVSGQSHVQKDGSGQRVAQITGSRPGQTHQGGGGQVWEVSI